MSILKEIPETCAYCGTTSRQKRFISWNSMINGGHHKHRFDAYGPALPQECPSCGYCSLNIEKEIENFNKDQIPYIDHIIKDKYPNIYSNDRLRPYVYFAEMIKLAAPENLTDITFNFAKTLFECRNSPDAPILINEIKSKLNKFDNENKVRIYDLLRELNEFDYVVEQLENKEELSLYEKEVLEKAKEKNNQQIYVF